MIRSIARRNPAANNRGGTAVEFAILLPVWLMLFFGLLDYGWYLTNLMVLENAVATGARAGVKTKYWLDEDPEEVAEDAAQNAFWISPDLTVTASRLDDALDDECSENCVYLQVSVSGFPYTPLVGYLPETLIPQTISAKAITVLP